MRRGTGGERDDREEVDLHVHHTTSAGILVSADGDDDQAVWLPIKHVDTVDGGPFGRGSRELLVPQWLLEREGLC